MKKSQIIPINLSIHIKACFDLPKYEWI